MVWFFSVYLGLQLPEFLYSVIKRTSKLAESTLLIYTVLCTLHHSFNRILLREEGGVNLPFMKVQIPESVFHLITLALASFPLPRSKPKQTIVYGCRVLQAKTYLDKLLKMPWRSYSNILMASIIICQVKTKQFTVLLWLVSTFMNECGWIFIEVCAKGYNFKKLIHSA